MHLPLLALLLLGFTLPLLGLGPLWAEACGGEEMPLLAASAQGPYQVAVGVLPPRPTTGSLRLMVSVCDAASGQPVEGALVSLVPTSPQGRRGAPIYALNRYTTPGEYSADLTVREAGLWHYQVTVKGAVGQVVLSAPLEVAQPAASQRPVTTAIFLLTGAVLVLGGFYLYTRARHGWPAAPPLSLH